ncbi:MAG: hypothetical protein ACI9K2_005263 [Myxococcota bacterium]|jgi:hypothetical protein
MFAVLLLLGCGGDEPDGGKPITCNAGTAWTGDGDVFADRTAEWGLEAIEPLGVRFSAVDFDGDGWIDLAVRGGNNPDDFGPDGVRSAWLLRNTGGSGFEDVTEASGIRQMRAKNDDRGRPGAVWVWADVDNDGDLDVYTGLPDGDVADADYDAHSELMLNNGDGTFVLADKVRDFTDPDDQPYGAAFVDVDRDGNIDLWTGQWAVGGAYSQDQLYLGDGGGGFDKATKKLGLSTEEWADIGSINAGLAHSGAWSAAACDLNNDGWPELLASSYGRAPNHLWRNEAGQFANASVGSGYASDDRTDWSDNESARCWCTLTPGDEDCEGVPAPEAIGCSSNADAFRWSHGSDREPYRLGGNSGAAVCRDVNNDGWLDLLTTEIVHWDVGTSSDPSELLFNEQDPDVRFRRPGNEVTGLTRTYDITAWNDGDITASVLDFDNDGWPDVFIGSSDYPSARGWLWRQVAPEQFDRVPPKKGIDHMRSHGSVAADFDRDGDLDFVVGHSTARCDEDCYSPAVPRFLENLTNDSGQSNWLQIRLHGDGVTANASAIGARVEVTAGGVTQTQEVVGGHGQWGSQDPLELHFGLGEACEAEVVVRWPDLDGTTATYSVVGNARYRVPMGSPVAVRSNLR